ncbi:lantibiotic dehydratase [Sphingobacterium sp.]|uniref:lantibiotic dehydratase n=1 Tax=Sphingobacterium sp. TaxID=341027 RepID=UPI0028ACC8FA|nr:lantibiotic dehydratase [Sphingobacterium sp.]
MNKKIKVPDFFIIRSPRLPYFYFKQMNAFPTEEKFWEFALKLLSESQILDSIFIASEEFHSQLKAAMSSPFNQKTRDLLPTLYKYIGRMTIRPTPFGLFSAISLAAVSNANTKLILSDKFVSKFRPDLSVLDLINKTLIKDLASLGSLCLYPNTTISTKKDYLTYIDFDDKTESRSFTWSRIKYNPLINIVLDICKEGMSHLNIIEKLVDLGIPKEKSIQFVEELVGLKILILETEPITTANSPLNTLLKIESISFDTHLAKPISQLTNHIRQIQQKNTSLSIQEIINYEHLLQNKPKNLLQADLIRKIASGTIDVKFIHTITKELFELQDLFKLDSISDLDIFINKFSTKYGEQEIPLLDALDEDFGIGYGSKNEINDENCPLLDGLVENYDEVPQDKDRLIQNYFEKQYIKNNSQKNVFQIKEKNLKEYRIDKTTDKPLPLGFYLLGNLLSIKDGCGTDDLKFNLLTAGGVSSLPLLTRFSHLDTDLTNKLKKCAEAEEKLAGEAIIAEIVFFPEGKAGNILTRPSLYKYEIPIIGQAAVDQDHTILLNDLLLRIVNGRIELRSKRLNKVILPRLSSAHNFHYSMTIYRFLCDLQRQDNPIYFVWDWGKKYNRTFLPRVEYKHLILSRAQWRIDRDIFDAINTYDDRQKANFLITSYGLPEKVLLVHGDNELMIDLRNDIGIKILLKELKKRDLMLYENIYDSFESPIIDSKGNMVTNEVIFPLLGDSLAIKTKLYCTTSKHIVRKFIPGSEWLYLKIYCGEKEGDNILIDQVKAFISTFTKEKLIQKWFFVRYYDPEPHIRIRFKLNKDIAKSYLKITTSVQNVLGKLVMEGRISRIIFDTYERELERYGPNNIENCERIFELESNILLNFLPIVKQYGEHIRWKFAMASTNNLLSAFGFESQEKLNFLKTLNEGFYNEFNRYHKLKFTLDQNYRRNYKEISHFFNNTIYQDGRIKAILEQHLLRLKSLHIQCLTSSDYLLRPREIVASLVHMLLNRIFYTQQREQEMVIYHFLCKFLISEIKKSDQSLPETPNLL